MSEPLNDYQKALLCKRMMVFTRKFWDLWLQKFFTLFVSVKVLGLISVLWVSTWLLIHHFISGGEWVTINTTIFGLIFAIREIFKTEVLGDVIFKNGNGNNKIGNGGNGDKEIPPSFSVSGPAPNPPEPPTPPSPPGLDKEQVLFKPSDNEFSDKGEETSGAKCN